jgi:hypothetical protein
MHAAHERHSERDQLRHEIGVAAVILGTLVADLVDHVPATLRRRRED